MSQENSSQVAMGSGFQEAMWPAGIAALLFSPVTVLANGLVLASILLDPFKNIRNSPSSNLIFSLALADFLVGILVEPLTGVFNISVARFKIQPFPWTTLLFAVKVLVGVSLFTLVALSVDRRIAITTPMQYKYKVTKKKIRLAIVSIWCYFFFAGIPLIVPEPNMLAIEVMFSVHWSIASIILVILNIATIRSVHNQGLNIKRNVGSENSLVLQNAFNREKTVTQTIIIMVVAFEICLWPIVILNIVVRVINLSNLQNNNTMLLLYSLLYTLFLANSLVNPFLYAWRLPKYRKAFQYILSLWKKKFSISQVQPQNNSSRQLSATTYHQVTLDSRNLPSLEQHDSNIKIRRQEADSYCSFYKVDVQDCINNEGHRMEDTRL